jgi:hypothetical protein
MIVTASLVEAMSEEHHQRKKNQLALATAQGKSVNMFGTP